MRIRLSLAAAGACSLLAGCSSSSGTSIGSRTLSVERVQETVQMNQDRVRSLKAEGRISVENPTTAQSGSFELVLHKPDSLLVRLQGPFGIKVGSALLTRDSLFYYNSFQNKLISGSTTRENLSRILKFNASFDDLLSLFTGGIFLPDDLRAADESRYESGQFVLVYHADGGLRQYWIDPSNSLIAKIDILDGEGKLVLEQTFERFNDVDGVSIPSVIRFIQPRERQLVFLTYSSCALNSESSPIMLAVPPSAERVRW